MHLILALLVVIALALVVSAIGRHRARYLSELDELARIVTPADPGAVYCNNCGRCDVRGRTFCAACGRALRRPNVMPRDARRLGRPAAGSDATSRPPDKQL